MNAWLHALERKRIISMRADMIPIMRDSGSEHTHGGEIRYSGAEVTGPCKVASPAGAGPEREHVEKAFSWLVWRRQTDRVVKGGEKGGGGTSA